MLVMNTQPPPPTDPALRISYVRLVDSLRARLPLPLSNTPGQSGPPSEYAIARRDTAALAMIASLDPADSIEADLAVKYVVTSAHATDALHLARQHPPESEVAIALRSQSAQLEQDAQGTRSLLRARQAARRRHQAADAAARQTAARPAWARVPAGVRFPPVMRPRHRRCCRPRPPRRRSRPRLAVRRRRFASSRGG